MAKEGLTAFQAVNRYFDEAARLIDLDEEMHSVLTSTYREISVQIPVSMDNGELVVVRGSRCVRARPPCPWATASWSSCAATACNTTARAVPTKGASGTTRAPSSR